MSTSVLELVEQEQAPSEDEGLMHAWCSFCQDAAEGRPIPSMCGYKSKAADETEALGYIPEGCCVVCRELAVRPCEKCGH